MPEHPFPDLNDPFEEQKRRYWRVVRKTVRDVFDTDPDIVETVRRRLSGAVPETQEKFYQTDPYSVAADIADNHDEATAKQQLDYLRIKESEDFGPVEIPDALLTEAGASYR